MAKKYVTYTIDDSLSVKIDWILDNSVQESKSGLVCFLIEREYVRLKKAKMEAEEAHC